MREEPQVRVKPQLLWWWWRWCRQRHQALVFCGPDFPQGPMEVLCAFAFVPLFSSARSSSLHTRTRMHTLGTEASKLVLDCSLPGSFVAVEHVAWVVLVKETFLSWRGGVGFIGKGPTSCLCPLDVGGRAWRGCCWDERTHRLPSRLLRDWPRWLRFADRVAPMATALQPSSHRVSAPALEVLANDHCRTDAQAERTLPLPSENATRCGVAVSRNTQTQTQTQTHLLVNEHLELDNAPENGVGCREVANAHFVEAADISAARHWRRFDVPCGSLPSGLELAWRRCWLFGWKWM